MARPQAARGILQLSFRRLFTDSEEPSAERVAQQPLEPHKQGVHDLVRPGRNPHPSQLCGALVVGLRRGLEEGPCGQAVLVVAPPTQPGRAGAGRPENPALQIDDVRVVRVCRTLRRPISSLRDLERCRGSRTRPGRTARRRARPGHPSRRRDRGPCSADGSAGQESDSP